MNKPSPLFLLPVILLFAVIFAVSCTDTGCTDNRSAIPYAGFYILQDGEPKAVSVDSLEIGGIGAPSDSLLIKADASTSALYLPFRFEHTSTAFFIHYASRLLSSPLLNDTISFTYTSSPRFVSEDCGAMFYYHIDEMTYTRHLIDSIAITDSLITNFDTERIRIFFRAATDEDDDDGDTEEGGQR